jgi:hypothetical protein
MPTTNFLKDISNIELYMPANFLSLGVMRAGQY